jgi:hypothetical protein
MLHCSRGCRRPPGAPGKSGAPREGCKASKRAPAFRLRSGIEREDKFFGVARREGDAGAFVEVIQIEGVGTQTRGAGFELGVFFVERGNALFERALLGLQLDVRDEALAARHGVCAEIKNARAQSDAHGSGATFRHRTDPKGGGKMSPDD